MHHLTKKGLAALAGLSLVIIGTPSASAEVTWYDEEDIHFYIGTTEDQTVYYNDFLEDEDHTHFDDAGVYAIVDGIEFSNQNESSEDDTFDNMGSIFIQFEDGDLFEADPRRCLQEMNEFVDYTRHSNLTFTCEAALDEYGELDDSDIPNEFADTDVEFTVKFEGNWFSYEVRVKDDALTNSYRIYVRNEYGPDGELEGEEPWQTQARYQRNEVNGEYEFTEEGYSNRVFYSNPEDAETTLEYSNSNLDAWLFSDSKVFSVETGSNRGNFRPIVGFRAPGAELKTIGHSTTDAFYYYDGLTADFFPGEFVTSRQMIDWQEFAGGQNPSVFWESDDIYFQSPELTMAAEYGQTFKVEGLILGWDNSMVDDAPSDASLLAFDRAVECGSALLQRGVFGSQQPFFFSNSVCNVPEAPVVQTIPAGVNPSENPQRAIGQGFTFTGQNLRNIQTVICNGISMPITSRSDDSIRVTVPTGLSGQADCQLGTGNAMFLANNAFRVIDGPAATYAKAVKGGKLNLRVYNAVGRTVRVFIDGTQRAVVKPQDLNTFVQIKNISAGKHKVVVRTAGKKLLERSFRAR